MKHKRDEGTATAFVVVWLMAAMLLSGLVFDCGMAIASKVSAVDVAQAASRAGARELDVTALRTTGTIRLDPIKAEIAARDWLVRSGINGTWIVTVIGNQVTVTITSAQPTQLLHLAGIEQIPLHASATADAISPAR
ncbi:hypothetical protein Rhe02_81280 [Rhizocola hellebori]|uniref:Putative Flp pilus-assembly TadG-like N-terminal domain-containing protein n=1 Tax=Rhizocola hellebori TaxID=1392758 RepID=A0A8J3VLI1_9ACTN|nr:pilus assembly protein TadG-related protein [Rhizocola hellebori]GIH10061.1 hypothetical protein Rhe02_81280 [Rhizocola hellebori]